MGWNHQLGKMKCHQCTSDHWLFSGCILLSSLANQLLIRPVRKRRRPRVWHGLQLELKLSCFVVGAVCFWGSYISYRRNVRRFVKHIPSLNFNIESVPHSHILEGRYMSQQKLQTQIRNWGSIPLQGARGLPWYEHSHHLILRLESPQHKLLIRWWFLVPHLRWLPW